MGKGDEHLSRASVIAPAISVERIRAFAVSARPSVGPVSSLGAMPVRNGVLVEITSKTGVTGWGEVWCNFPPRGNLARLNLLQDVIAPQLIGATFHHYSDCRTQFEETFARMAIHTGEFGLYAHCLAGIDMALADIAARSLDMRLSKFLSNTPALEVPVYASTPDVTDMENALAQIIDAGHQGIKLKIGLGLAIDANLLRGVVDFTQGQLRVMVDANQNWTVTEAIETMAQLSDYSIDFLEEPLRADTPLSDWAMLASATDVPLAAGENITSQDQFSAFMDDGLLRVVQPDVAKWGGISGAMEVGQLAAERDLMCALHYMGSGVGLAASLHTLAAIGGSGSVELDANPNPLRTDLGEIDLTVKSGMLQVPPGPGHGFIPDTAALKSRSVAQFEAT